MKTYTSISSLGDCELVDYFEEFTKFDKSVADRRFFTPTREAVKNIPSGTPNINQFYDFPSGADDGRTLPRSRIKGVDIAEISNEVLRGQQELRSKISDIQQEKQIRDSLKLSSETTEQS